METSFVTLVQNLIFILVVLFSSEELLKAISWPLVLGCGHTVVEGVEQGAQDKAWAESDEDVEEGGVREEFRIPALCKERGLFVGVNLVSYRM